MAESLFRVFDEDKSGTLSFEEYFQASQVGHLDSTRLPYLLYLPSHKLGKPQVSDLNSVEDKLSWIFTAFDSDGGGSIDYDEITDICQGLFRLAGIQEDEDMLASCVADVRSEEHFKSVRILSNYCVHRSTIDGDGDGDISKEEFVKNGMQSKFIADLLTKQQYND